MSKDEARAREVCQSPTEKAMWLETEREKIWSKRKDTVAILQLSRTCEVDYVRYAVREP